MYFVFDYSEIVLRRRKGIQLLTTAEAVMGKLCSFGRLRRIDRDNFRTLPTISEALCADIP